MMKNYRRNILSLACGLGAAAVLDKPVPMSDLLAWVRRLAPPSRGGPSRATSRPA